MFSRYAQITHPVVLGGVLVTAFTLPGLAHSPQASTSTLYSVAQQGFTTATWNSLKQTEDEPPLTSSVQQPLDRLTDLLAEDEPPLTSRTLGLCPISPGLIGETNQIWSDRPLFIWRGDAERLVLINFSTQEQVWEQELQAGDRFTTIPEGTLEPGQSYQWEISNATVRSDSYIFQVIAPEQRAEITADLINLEAQLKANGATEETIAAERAYYFAQLGLWSDAMQVLQTVEAPSTDLTETLQTLVNYVCLETQTSDEPPQ